MGEVLVDDAVEAVVLEVDIVEEVLVDDAVEIVLMLVYCKQEPAMTTATDCQSIGAQVVFTQLCVSGVNGLQ